jgi:hypothetical protein
VGMAKRRRKRQGGSPKRLECSGEASAWHSFNWSKLSPRD